MTGTPDMFLVERIRRILSPTREGGIGPLQEETLARYTGKTSQQGRHILRATLEHMRDGGEIVQIAPSGYSEWHLARCAKAWGWI